MDLLKVTLKPIVADIGRLAAIWTITIISILPCAHVIWPPEAAASAWAPVLETKIFVQSDEPPGLAYAAFDVPEAGEAILRVVNAARVGAAASDRLQGAEITLNGKVIVKAPEFDKTTDVLALRITLLRGTNRLGVKLPAKSGKRLSVRIDAYADRIVLDPVANAVVAGEPIRAVARVTGLGLPVDGANVRFEVVGTGVKKTVPTGPSGSASAFLEVNNTGSDRLKATVMGSRPTLVDETPVNFLARRGLVLAQRPASLRLAAGSDRLVQFTIDVRSVKGAKDRITLKSVVAPGGNDLNIVAGFPEEGLDVAAPQRIPVIAKIMGAKPGFYTVTTVATAENSGETFSVALPVDVVKPGTPDPLLLGIPSATPLGVEPNTQTRVIFRAQVDGASTPPEGLFLDELDLTGKPLKLAVSELRDEGKGEDTVARDGIYSGMLEIDRPAAELRFRVRAAYFGKEVASGGMSFLVTPFPPKARPSNPDLLVPLPGSRSRVFANEVVIKLIPGVSPDDVAKIAASIDGTVAGVIPPLRIYLIEFPGDGSAKGVMEAIATLSTFSQVESSAPNFEVVNNAISFNFGTACGPAAAGCPDDGNDPDQWYLTKIEARQAWDRAGGGSSSAKVAVLDAGVNCGQGDLDSRCPATGTDAHATQVAGLIAANANNTKGIAGIAWNTQVESVTAGVGDGSTFETEMNTVSMIPEVKILNISQTVHLFDSIDSHVTQIGHLRDAVCHAVDAHKLVVVSGGNIVSEDDESSLYPVKLNSEPGGCPGGQSMEKHLLAVGGSDQSDGRASWGGVQKSSDAAYLDIYAPGVDIRTITHPGGEMTVNGTSFATALVSGAAAVLWSHDAFTTPAGQTRARAVHDRLITTGDTVPSICATCKRLNLFAAVPPGNQPPAGTDRTVSTSEDNDYIFAAGDFGFTDPNDSPPNAFAGLIVTTTAANGILYLDADGDFLVDAAEAVSSLDTIAVADINAGRLKFKPAANASGSAYDSFSFQVRDDGGGTDTDPSPNSITIDVTAVNDAPTGADRTVSTSEDTDYVFAAGDFAFSDPNDSPPNAFAGLLVTPTAGNGTLYLDINANSLVDPGEALGNPDTVAIADINAGRLKFKPAANENGSSYDNFTFQIRDDGGGTDTDPTPNTITIDVIPVDDPYDIVFVLDRSGSMALTTAIDPPASDRWDALKRAVAPFANIIESIGSTCTGSRFSLTLFASKVLSFGDPDPNFELHDNDFSALVNIGSGLQNKVSTELNLQTPFGSTAMGAGLQNGIAKFNDDTRARVIVLFSDGLQNQDPMVDSTGTGYEGGGGIAPGGSGPFKIVTVGIGSSSPNSNYQSILQGLASNHDGSYHSTSTGVGLEATLQAAVQDALDSCSPQMVVSHSGTLSNTVTLPAFDLNRKVNQLLLIISFGRDFKASEFATVLAGIHIEKAGTEITPYFQQVIMGSVSNSVLLKADFAAPHPRFGAIAPAGSYTLRMKKPENIEGNLSYRVVAYADDHKLDMDWNVSPFAPRVNQPFTPAMHLLWDGHPLTKANVEVLISQPGADLGDSLARHPMKVDPRDVDIFGSPGTQKYNYLLEHDIEFLKRLLPNEQRFTLAHQEDGTYRATYNPGDISGIYQVFYRVRAELPTAGKIQRVVMQSVYVRFGDIDLDRSAVSSSVQGSNLTISMRPMTTYDRFIGPAQGSAFSVDGDDIKLSSITDHQDGSYTLVLTGKTDAQVTIKLLGEKIYQGPASRFGE